LNRALEEAGIVPYETDLADLIIQLGQDRPSHIVVPALHKNRAEIRELFQRTMKLESLGPEPEDLTRAARAFLREKFLRVKVGFSGANFVIADTGSVCVVESEGNGRMCVTLPQCSSRWLASRKIIPSFGDLEVFLQLLSRSATGERMNPHNSIWTGVRAGDGPEEFHVVLLDNGRTTVLADEVSRETLDCTAAAACLNACPVYRQTGGHAYGSSLQRSDRRDPDAAVAVDAALDVAAVCVVALRCVLRGVSGQNQHSGDSDSPAPADRRATRADRRAAEHEGGGAGVRGLVAPVDRPEARARGAVAVQARRPSVRDGRLLRRVDQRPEISAIPSESFREWWAKRGRRAG
jgi:L-lactate dehydrogenase complex protein LldF